MQTASTPMPADWMPSEVKDYLLCVEASHHWRAGGKNYAMALGFRRTGSAEHDDSLMLKLRQSFWDKIQQTSTAGTAADLGPEDLVSLQVVKDGKTA